MDYFFEGIGILASLLVSVSLCMKNIKALRIVNLCGSAVFFIYGILIVSPSIIILNTFSVLVNIFYLSKMKAAGPEVFDTLFIKPAERDLLSRFVTFHAGDIRRFFPSFDPDLTKGTLAGAECCFILRETLPVSLVAYKRRTDNEIDILVDYVIPAYRDFQNARYFFGTAVKRIAPPGTVFYAAGEAPKHISYLKRMGFTGIGRDGKVSRFSRTI
ncbi:MAG: hypothetical protein LBQ44_08105 [Treponema sp.]|jgi:hypothetical protein|nr:hypothetical protein [Treponema sp.]